MIEIRHLQKTYPDGGNPLKDVNCIINDGDVISLIGPSGTGKSTLLRCIDMLDPPTGGQILLDGEDVTLRNYPVNMLRRRVGMVFQSFNLFEHLSVIENIMMPQIRLLGRSRQEAYDRGMELLQNVGMSDKSLSLPQNLSGGQKQRAAIARALSMDPEVILFDEPTSALDPTMVDEVKAVIRSVAQTGVTTFIVTHDMDFAREICNRVFYMDQGIIYEEGLPEQIFEHPAKELTKRFVRKLKVYENTICSKNFDCMGMMSSIKNFGIHNRINFDLIERVERVSEELICSLVIPQLGDDFTLKYSLEYRKEPLQITVSVKYDGPINNPIAAIIEHHEDNRIHPEDDVEKVGKTAALGIVDYFTEKSRFSYDEDRELPNNIKILLRTD